MEKCGRLTLVRDFPVLTAEGLSVISIADRLVPFRGPPWIRTRPVRLSPGSIALCLDLPGIRPLVTQNPSVFEAH